MEEIIIQSAENVFRNGTSPNHASHDSANAEMRISKTKVFGYGCGTSRFSYGSKMKGTKMFWQLTLMNGQLKILKKR